jgi:hypothetical protein
MIMKLLVRNAKMRKSATSDRVFYNFGIPAFRSGKLKTCPNALDCVSGCYARQGAYIWSNVNAAYRRRLDLYLESPESFRSQLIVEILGILERHPDKVICIRVHDSGDFFNRDYLEAYIFEYFGNIPRLCFYAYTKQVSLFKTYAHDVGFPSNFSYVFSLGGKEDHIIECGDCHALVVGSVEDMPMGYVNGTDDDWIAASGEYKRIGLVYHGARGFSKTGFSK